MALDEELAMRFYKIDWPDNSWYLADGETKAFYMAKVERVLNALSTF